MAPPPPVLPPPPPPLPVSGTHASLVVAEASENWLGLEGEAAAELGAGGAPLPPEMPVLALLLLELLAESCFFLELLNFTLPESVSFSFSNNLLIGRSMMKAFWVFLVTFLGKVLFFTLNLLKYKRTAEQMCSSQPIVSTTAIEIVQ